MRNVMTENTSSAAQSKPVALFASDVHLQASMPQTTQAFLNFLSCRAIDAQQLYLLGDLFEYWAGDDDIGAAYNQQIVAALRTASDAGVRIFWIAGNRDFLIGADFAAATGCVILPDPSVVTIAGHRIALAHGDAQCTDDSDYMAFREKVRQQDWQQDFLAMPLMQRKAIIAGLRNGSREAQRTKSCEIMDVNREAIASVFDTTNTSILIHGHTHRPSRHEIEWHGGTRVRYVLPDWEYDVEPSRGGWLELHEDGSFKQVGTGS
jgi:UDP-2,3-diacylglucosamine hydrolase